MLDSNGLAGWIDERFTRTLFRLETHQVLTGHKAEDQTRRWLAGDPPPARREWEDVIRSEVERGKITRRVLTIDGRPTDYLRRAIDWGYLGNVRAGELCRVVERDTAEVDVGHQDFWLVDDRHVLLMHYTDKGALIGGEPVEDDTELGRWLDVSRAAWDAGTDLTSWWADHPEYHRPAGAPTPRNENERPERADAPTATGGTS